MDENYIRKTLNEKGWFKNDSHINEVISLVALHEAYQQKGKAAKRVKLLQDAKIQVSRLMKTMNKIERDHAETHLNLMGYIELRRAVDNDYDFHNTSEESISDMLKLIEGASTTRLQDHQKSELSNMMKMAPDGRKEFFFTNKNSTYYHVFTELERVWRHGTRKPMIKSDDSEFMIFLSICLRGNEDQSSSMRTQISRIRTKAGSWKQKQEK